MDHSSIEAFLFLIECDNKKVIYTGDFRDTGYTGLKAIKALNKNEEIKNADYILIEDTNINRGHYEFKTEKNIEEKLEEIFKQQENISFVYGAKSNIDRIIATFKACIKANKILFLDVYTSYIIYIVSLQSTKLDILNSKNKKVKVYYAHTTGHATKELLLNVVKNLKPKNIVPVHTDNPEKLKKYFNKDGLNNIQLFEDYKTYKVE